MLTVLDLCAGTGAWSKPYEVAGYNVVKVDLPNDVRLFHYPGTVHGILAAPPCRVFCRSGQRWHRTTEEVLDGLSVVDACLRLVSVCNPQWWALENPIGTLVRYLGKPAMYFNPCDFGDPYTKRTCLWGKFNQPVKSPVDPELGSLMALKYGGPGEKTRRVRAMTPPGFAKAFFEANP